MFKLVFYVPESHLKAVKDAVFSAGAGQIGAYSRCAWQVLGQGQFQPMEGSRPYLGKQGEVETVMEYRVELVCSDENVKGAVSALKTAHPYEMPAYDVWQLADV